MPQLFNQSLDDEPLYERIEAFSGGMDGFTRATLLPPDASQYLENVIIPDNYELRTRPGADTLGANLGSGALGLLYFDTPDYEQLLTATNGALQHWSGGAWTTIAGFAPTNPVAMAQGVETALLTDGATVHTWNGTTLSANLVSGVTDPPTGATLLLWHAGRMWAAGFGGGSGVENDSLHASDRLDFGSGGWDSTQRNIRIGAGEGDPIVGLASMISSADGGFIMAVLKGNSVWMLNTDPSLDFGEYSATNFALSQRVSDGIGCVGRRAYCVFGNDLLFVSPDRTIRSLARMQAAASQFEISPPLSLPMQPYIDRINWDYASLIAVQKYRELVLFAVPLDSSTSPNAVLVWNGRLKRWAGVWTGWGPACWEVTRFGGNTSLVFGDSAGNVKQWKDDDDKNLDATYLDDAAPVASKGWTRAMLFGDPLCDKDPFHAELRFSQSNGIVTVTLVADNSDLKTWTVDVTQRGPDLPLDLPFDLAASINTAARRGLRGLRPFNECYLKIESASGWWSLRTVSLSAFVNTIRNQ